MSEILVVNFGDWCPADADDGLGRTHKGWKDGLTPDEQWLAFHGCWALNGNRLRGVEGIVGMHRLVGVIAAGAPSRVYVAGSTSRGPRYAFDAALLGPGDDLYDRFVGKTIRDVAMRSPFCYLPADATVAA